MNFPTVEFSWLGNGSLIGIIAIIHVLISHGVAIGSSVLVVSLEYKALQSGHVALDQFAKKMCKWVLIITTTAGAMTGVAIWFSTTVVQPDSIGSLLRIFFWAWVAEWVVFITEVILILVYYYTWDRWKTGKEKLRHLKVGIALAVFSWLTMAIITGVLAAKLAPGRWSETLSFWNAFFNPTYLPSLGFRMFLAIILAIVFTTLIVKWRVKDERLRAAIFRVFAGWGAVSLPASFLFGVWYLQQIPQSAYNLVIWSTGMSETMFKLVNYTTLAIILLFLAWLVFKAEKLPLLLSIAVFGASVGFIGEFEMVRESVRKPYIIYNYMYANGMLAQNVEKINREGYLTHATFATVKQITAANRVEAGREIYQGQCMACHTIDGWRSSRAMTNRVGSWSKETIASFIPNMHTVRPMMPPFMGTKEELDALATYLADVTKREEVAQQ